MKYHSFPNQSLLSYIHRRAFELQDLHDTFLYQYLYLSILSLSIFVHTYSHRVDSQFSAHFINHQHRSDFAFITYTQISDNLFLENAILSTQIERFVKHMRTESQCQIQSQQTINDSKKMINLRDIIVLFILYQVSYFCCACGEQIGNYE